MATGLTVVHKMRYRLNLAEEWSNTYWFNGTTPADATAWAALASALSTIEKACYSSRVTTVAYYGYDNDTDDRHAVWSEDHHASPVHAGTLTVSGQSQGGDAAAWVRFRTGRITSTGKKIYLRKYFHDVYLAGGADPDALLGTQIAALETFGNKLVDGTFSGSRELVGRGHATDVIDQVQASTHVTTRTLKRRGKRPPP